MADCSKEFLDFDKRISLNKTERKLLRKARKAITNKIVTCFKQNPNCPDVEFKPQGSFSMGTIIKPLNGEYDIDIGVYLKGYSNWQRDWPKPEIVSYWLTSALKNHTSIPLVNKRNCIRVTYKPINIENDVSYHVDLPIYCDYINFLEQKKTRIGITGETQWSNKSNPIKFTEWFFEKCKKNKKDKGQLIRLVKYMKAWKEHINIDSKFPSGMAFTVLLANNYYPDKRDDISFRETIRKSYNNLYFWYPLWENSITSPLEPYNDLLAKLTAKQKQRFKNTFEELVDDAKKAIKEFDKEIALSFWKKHFDRRMEKY